MRTLRSVNYFELPTSYVRLEKEKLSIEIAHSLIFLSYKLQNHLAHSERNYQYALITVD